MSEKKQTAKPRPKAKTKARTRPAPRRPKKEADAPMPLTIRASYMLSDRAFKPRATVRLEPRQARALRAIFDAMFFEGAVDCRGHEVATQESALRLLLDRAADSMGYPRKSSDPRPK